MFNKKLNLAGTKLLILGLFFISFAIPCYASGLPSAYQAPSQQPKLMVPYVGVDVGYGWSKFKYKTDNSIPATLQYWSDSLPSKSFDNVFLGGILGTQFNIPSYEQIFLATQLTFDFYPEGTSYTNKNYPSHAGADTTAYGGVDQKWQAGFSLLAGYHVTPIITPYLIGGVTYNGFTSKYSFTSGSFTTSDSKNFERFGWLVGAGIEAKFTKHIAVRLEYNYQDYGNYSYDSTENIGVLPMSVHHKISFDGNNVIRANLLWYF